MDWSEVINTKKLISGFPSEKNIDIWAGRGGTDGMQAIYRYLVWQNRKDLFCSKENQRFGKMGKWGPMYGFKFKLYVAEFPEEPAKVGVTM